MALLLLLPPELIVCVCEYLESVDPLCVAYESLAWCRDDPHLIARTEKNAARNRLEAARQSLRGRAPVSLLVHDWRPLLPGSHVVCFDTTNTTTHIVASDPEHFYVFEKGRVSKQTKQQLVDAFSRTPRLMVCYDRNCEATVHEAVAALSVLQTHDNTQRAVADVVMGDGDSYTAIERLLCSGGFYCVGAK